MEWRHRIITNQHRELHYWHLLLISGPPLAANRRSGSPTSDTKITPREHEKNTKRARRDTKGTRREHEGSTKGARREHGGFSPKAYCSESCVWLAPFPSAGNAARLQVRSEEWLLGLFVLHRGATQSGGAALPSSFQVHSCCCLLLSLRFVLFLFFICFSLPESFARTMRRFPFLFSQICVVWSRVWVWILFELLFPTTKCRGRVLFLSDVSERNITRNSTSANESMHNRKPRPDPA